MNSDLWIVFAVTAAFIGFLMGYGVPPMQEVGLEAIGGQGHGGSGAEESTEADAAAEQFEQLKSLME